MNYAKRRRDGSDVHVSLLTDNTLVCCGCDLEGGGDFETVTRSQMIEHLHEHRSCWHNVPEYTIRQLLEELEQAGDDVRRKHA